MRERKDAPFGTFGRKGANSVLGSEESREHKLTDNPPLPPSRHRPAFIHFLPSLVENGERRRRQEEEEVKKWVHNVPNKWGGFSSTPSVSKAGSAIVCVRVFRCRKKMEKEKDEMVSFFIFSERAVERGGGRGSLGEYASTSIFTLEKPSTLVFLSIDFEGMTIFRLGSLSPIVCVCACACAQLFHNPTFRPALWVRAI